ncbi:hypothetical protein SLE2022_166020 [Rubroshorea leprosula]
MEKRLGHGYEPGDMVWGKVKSHPWWPGQIFDEAFASPSVTKTKKEGCVLVAFFGDDSFGWFNPTELVPFDSNFVKKSKQTNAKTFLDAVEDAKYEICRRAALGLSCYCQNPSSFQATGVQGCFAVEVEGYQPGAIYSRRQIEIARNGFRPIRLLCFLQLLALIPCGNPQNGVDWIRNVAVVLAYRKAVFKKFDVTRDYAFAVGAQHTESSVEILDLPKKMPFQASPTAPPEVPASIKITKNSKWDASGLLCCQEKQSFLSPSMYEKESALATVDHIVETGALAGSVTLKAPCLQDDNDTFYDFSMSCIPGHVAKEAPSGNRKQELETTSGANCGHLDNLETVSNTLSLPGVVSDGKVFANSESRDEKFEELVPEKVSIGDKRKAQQENESETGPENAHKHLRSTLEEASPFTRKQKWKNMLNRFHFPVGFISRRTGER